MKKQLKDIAKLTSGVYLKPGISNDVLYLQAVHFDSMGVPDPIQTPRVGLNAKSLNHILRENDVLFAAKGINNFGVVYRSEFGQAVASSSFIVIRLHSTKDINPEYLAWFLSTTPAIQEFHKRQLGSTIPSISIEKLKNLEVVIPTIEKQRLIVQIQYLKDKEEKLTQKLLNAKDEKVKKLLLNVVNHTNEQG